MLEQKVREDMDVTGIGIPVTPEEGRTLKEVFSQLGQNPRNFYARNSADNRIFVKDGHVISLDFSYLGHLDFLPENLTELKYLQRIDIYETRIQKTDPVVQKLMEKGVEVQLEPPCYCS